MARKLTYEELERRVKELENEAAEYKQVKRVPTDSEGEYLHIINLLPEAVVIQDKGEILFANEAFAKLIGMQNSGDLIGKSLFDFSPDGPLSERKSPLGTYAKKILSNILSPPFRAHPVRKKDGSKSYVEITDRKITYRGQEALLGIHKDVTERKQMEESLTEAVEKYRKFFEHAGFGIVVFNAKTKKRVGFNKTAYESMGFSREEFENMPMGYSEDAEITNEMDMHLEKIINNGGDVFETKHITKSGEVRDMLISAVPIRIGGEYYIQNIRADITDRKQVERALRESEEFSTSLLEHSPNPILVINSDTSVRYVNPALERLTGYSTEDVMGNKAPFPWWIEDSRSVNIDERIDSILEGVTGLERLFRKKNGEDFWVEINTAPIKQDGELKYSLTTWNDITERKQAEEALQESEEKYRKLFEHAGFAISLIDAETGNRVAFNKVAHESLGYAREEFQELNTRDFVIFDKSNTDSFEERTKRIIEKGSHTFETKQRKKNGEIRDMLVSNVPIVIGGKQLVQGIRVDITERKRMGEALQKAHDELERQVEDRTSELRIKSSSLEEMNTALRVLLKKRDEDRAEIEEKVLMNVKELVEPYLEKLKGKQLDDNQRALLDVLESNLNYIISPFIGRLSSKRFNLTHMEIQVATLVRQGKSSKEIANILNISKKTIDSHRDRIRRKLGIKNKKVNLRTHLASIP